MKNWYSVRCIFEHPKLRKKNGDFAYEERILLWETESLDKAIELAEEEALKYSENCDCNYIGLAQAYHTFITKPESGSEVYSLIRDDDSEPEEYLDFYFDTGSERQKDYEK